MAKDTELDEEVRGMKSARVPMELGCATLLAYGCVHLPGSLSNLVRVSIKLSQQHPSLTATPSQVSRWG